jgi:hypothetical protein
MYGQQQQPPSGYGKGKGRGNGKGKGGERLASRQGKKGKGGGKGGDCPEPRKGKGGKGKGGKGKGDRGGSSKGSRADIPKGDKGGKSSAFAKGFPKGRGQVGDRPVSRQPGAKGSRRPGFGKGTRPDDFADESSMVYAADEFVAPSPSTPTIAPAPVVVERTGDAPSSPVQKTAASPEVDSAPEQEASMADSSATEEMYVDIYTYCLPPLSSQWTCFV